MAKTFLFPALLVLFALAGCGDLPRPFAGRPGANAVLLATPPPSRLAIPTPGTALLSDAAADGLSAALAAALQTQEVPAVAGPSHPGDWKLLIAADLRDGTVVPVYTVQNPQGETKGSIEGAPISPSAWANATRLTMDAIAQVTAPRLGTLLTAIEATRRQSDPTSLANRPVRVRLNPVTGAPGDGNQSLTRQMRLELVKLGQQVQDKPEGADYTVRGEVATTPTAGRQMRVEITWTVFDARNKEAGKIAQLNEVPAGTLSGLWADVAVVVAQEAAGGVRDVILNQIGGRQDRKADAAPPPK